MNGPKTSICVNYRNTDGWHVFTSEDLPGLYVMSQDPKVAFEDVKIAIEKLLELNQGIKTRVEPEIPFDEFVKIVNHSDASIGKAPLILTSKRYAIYAEK